MAKQNNNKIKPDWGAYVLFLCITVIFILASIICFITEKEMPAYLLLTLGASIFVVLIVEFIWRSYGGDPITKAIISLRQTIKKLGELESSGIASIKLVRRDFEQTEYVNLWRSLIEKATEVDLMAFTLTRQIAGKENIIESLEKAISLNRCRVRMLTFRPFKGDSDINPIAAQRIKEEELLSTGKGTREKIHGFLQITWDQVRKIQEKFKKDPQRKDCLKIKATTEINLYVNIIRIDERMWVSPYMSSTTGGSNPVFEISGNHTPLFQLYLKEFEHMFSHAQDVEL
jgi:hypothetical protein